MPETEKLILWAWPHQKELNISIEQVLHVAQQDAVGAVWNALSLLHRFSSLAESWHSCLRPYLQVHRGMPEWLLPLLQLVWNHNVLRGKRDGKSSMMWAGFEQVPTLSSLFDYLVNPEKTSLHWLDFLRCNKVLPYFVEKMNHSKNPEQKCYGSLPPSLPGFPPPGLSVGWRTGGVDFGTEFP
jgi:hypothetical protein